MSGEFFMNSGMVFSDTKAWPHWLPVGMLLYQSVFGERRWLQAAGTSVPFSSYRHWHMFYFAAHFNTQKLNNFVYVVHSAVISMKFNCIANERKSGMGKRWGWTWSTLLPGMCMWYQTRPSAVCGSPSTPWCSGSVSLARSPLLRLKSRKVGSV